MLLTRPLRIRRTLQDLDDMLAGSGGSRSRARTRYCRHDGGGAGVRHGSVGYVHRALPGTALRAPPRFVTTSRTCGRCHPAVVNRVYIRRWPNGGPALWCYPHWRALRRRKSSRVENMQLVFARTSWIRSNAVPMDPRKVPSSAGGTMNKVVALPSRCSPDGELSDCCRPDQNLQPQWQRRRSITTSASPCAHMTIHLRTESVMNLHVPKNAGHAHCRLVFLVS